MAAKTGIHIKPCNVNSVEAHNERTQAYLDGVKKSGRNLYFFQELTHKNESWVNPDYQWRTCAQVFEDLKALYKSKIGQEPQLKDKTRTNKKTGKKYTVSGWSPIREGVIPIEANTHLKDFIPILEWAKENGVNIIRIDMHHDEGYRDEVSGDIKFNHHAHIVFDWIDYDTGTTAKLGADKMSELQDVIAKALKMQRGEAKAVTGKEHLAPEQFKEQKAAEHVKELEAKTKQLNVSKARKEALIEASHETVEGVKSLFGASDRDKQIKSLTEQVNALQDENKKLKDGAEKEKQKAVENTRKVLNAELAKVRQQKQSLQSSLDTTRRERDEARKTADVFRGLLASVWEGLSDAIKAMLELAFDDRRRNFTRTEVAAIDNALGTDNDTGTRRALGRELIRRAKEECPDRIHEGRIDAQRQDIEAIASREYQDRSQGRGIKL